MDTMITTSEAARRLHITIGRVRQLIYEGKISAKMFGRDWMIDPLELDNVTIYGKAGRPKKSSE